MDADFDAGYVGLFRGQLSNSTQQFDDVKVGFDNNADGDIDDAGDDIQIDDDFNTNVITLSYDNNGNLTNDGLLKYEYDAWNRLVEAIRTDGTDETTIATYAYYPDNRRSEKIVTNCGTEIVSGDGGNTTVRFYYCGTGFQPENWSICETRNGSNQTTFQYLWGTQYIDELIMIDKNGDPTESNDCDPDDQTGESTADARYFVHQDRNWNVVALSEYDTGDTNNGRLVERYSYTPYGQFVVLAGDTGSGQLASASPHSPTGRSPDLSPAPWRCGMDWCPFPDPAARATTSRCACASTPGAWTSRRCRSVIRICSAGGASSM